MIALDTNILIRYIVQDDKAQAKKATKLIEELVQSNPAFISCIVLCEINWVLKTAYKTSKEDCIEILQRIISVAVFDIEKLDICLKALKSYKAGTADFSDYLIQEIAANHGYDTVISFDKKALKSAGFQNP